MTIEMAAFDLIPILIYILLILWFGFKARRKDSDTDEFLLGGRSLSLPAFVATLVSTWYGGILGVGEFVYRQGISVWFVFGLPYYFFALLFALLLAPKIRSSESYSIPDMFYRTYDKPTGLLGSTFILFMTSPAPYILMVGLLLQQLFQLNFLTSIIIGTLISIVYVYWGGFRSVVQTDIIQFMLMFAGFIVLFIYLINGTVPLRELPGQLDAVHKSWNGGLNWQQLIVWFLIASWTFIDPGFHQRCSAARTTKIARNGILVSIAFWFVFDMLTLTTGLYAFVLLPDTNPILSYPNLGQHILPAFFKGLFFTGLLATIMSTVDSYTFLSALTFGNDIVTKFNGINKGRDIKFWVRIGLVITAVISIILIMLIPSVVQMWYNLGSLFIPPMLLPLLAVYFPALRISGRMTLLAMVLSFLLASASFIWGHLNFVGGNPDYLFGVEPFFPGLLVSIVLYSYGILSKFSNK